MKIIRATNNEREAIFNIWLSCFTEDEAYINNYLEYCFPHTTTLLLGDEQMGYVSVISILPAYFIKDNRKYKGGYLYGVGTLPDYRGKSYSKKLINHAKELLLLDNCDFFIVKPATSTLFDLYRRSGFSEEIYKAITVIEPAGNHSTSTIKEIIDVELLFNIREKNLSETSFLWPKELLAYTYSEILNRDGFIFIDENTGNYCTGYPEEDSNSIKILESSTKPGLIQPLFGHSILNKYPKKDYWVIDFPYIPGENSQQQLSALVMELSPGTIKLCHNLHLSLPME